MINMFCLDSAFSDLNKKLGYLSDGSNNYFYNAEEIQDLRSSFLINSTRVACDYFGCQAYGTMSLVYDNLRVIPNYVRATAISQEDQECLNVIASDIEKRNRLFNIIEFCFLEHSTTGSMLNPDEFNVKLQNSAQFIGYAPNSLILSDSATKSMIHLNDNGVSKNSNEILFNDWIQFDFRVTDTLSITLKIWLSESIFKQEYPISVLTKCVYPCDPRDLLNMSYTEVPEAIAEAASYSGAISSTEITQNDHTGSIIFSTKYIASGSITSYNMPFTVFYKGATPTLSELRNYIKDSLFREYPTVTEFEWRSILPNLFVTAAYFIVPNYTNRVYFEEEQTWIDKGASNLNAFLAKIQLLYPNRDYNSYATFGNLVKVAGSGLDFYAFPAEDNDEQHQEVMIEHPSYIAVDAYDQSFAHMTSYTQIFARHLSNAIKLAQGDKTLGTISEYTKVQVDRSPLFYILFVVNGIEYYMLMKESY